MFDFEDVDGDGEYGDGDRLWDLDDDGAIGNVAGEDFPVFCQTSYFTGAGEPSGRKTQYQHPSKLGGTG